MSKVWTITYGGVEKTVADWGLTAQPVIRTRDRSPTSFRFRMAGAAPEGAIPFPFKAEIKIRQGRVLTDAVWGGGSFVWIGYQTTQVGRVTGKNQGITLVFQDAIWLLQNTTFQQLWNQNVSDGMGGVTTTQVPVSRVVLFMDINSYIETPWTVKSVQWEINEIISWAATCGINIAAGTIDLDDWYLNYYHVRAVSCWDALLKCVEPIPDAKIWIDGSTTPPQLNVRTRATLAAMDPPTTTAPGPITLQYKGQDDSGRVHVSSELTPRYDLIPPQVVIQYQTNTTLDGKPAPTWGNDVYPPDSDGKTPFAMVVPIDLTGANEKTETGQLDCETLACIGGTHDEKRAWWASKRGGEQSKLTDFRVRFQDTSGNLVEIGDATVTDDNGDPIDLDAYPRRHVRGSFHAWMKNGDTQINAIRAHVKVKVQFAEYDVVGATPDETDTNGNVIRKSTTHELHCHIVLTNSPDGVKDYDTLNILSPAETAVEGLAENIYNSRSQLDYDGSHEIIDPGTGEIPPLAQLIGHWNLLNLTGGDVDWETANMTIAGTEIDLFTNHQTIEVGPSKHLSAQDWNEMLQFFRDRRVYMFAGQRATGYGNPSDNVDMARNTPDANTVPGLVVDSALTQIQYETEDDPTSEVTGRINSDAKLIETILAAATPTPIAGASGDSIKTMQPREVQMCDADGNEFLAIVHCTDGYTKA